MKGHVAIAAALASSTAVATPLAPIGKWGLDHQPQRCILQHAFGTTEAEHKLAIVVHPGRFAEILLIAPKAAPMPVSSANGSVTVQPGGKSFPGTVQATRLDDGSIASSIRVNGALIDLLPIATQLDFAANGATAVSLTLPAMTAATNALDICQQDEAVALGIDPAMPRHRAVGHEIANAQLRRHVGVDSYPEAAQGASGTSVVLVTIGAEGPVTDCRIAESSGNAALDQRACETARRFRYPPEHDAAGKPVASWMMLGIVWQGEP